VQLFEIAALRVAVLVPLESHPRCARALIAHLSLSASVATIESMKSPRITLRCYTEDLCLALPSLQQELDADHPLVDELIDRAPTAPAGLKRILSIRTPLAYRLQRGRYRGAAWPDESRAIFWLLAAGLRRAGSSDDAYCHFERLHDAGRLLPTDDDAARMRLEAAARRYRAFATEVPASVGEARRHLGESVDARLGGDIPCRLLLVPGHDVDELWVAVGIVTADGKGVEPRERDMIFALVEAAAGRGDWEAVSEWPGAELRWFEVARYGLLED
jgi:hypothetical protein